MPQFPGGQEMMMKYLAANIKYPASAVKAKKQGRVIVTFVIQKDGSVTKARIARSVDPELDAKPELMRKNLGLKMIRRNNSIGHHYFIANLTSKDIAL